MHISNQVEYSKLTGRQQENYNFVKLSAVLADFGFATVRLTDDWCGADFIAMHMDGKTLLKVQLKGRLYFGKKYLGKDLLFGFCANGDWYLYPHDSVLEQAL